MPGFQNKLDYIMAALDFHLRQGLEPDAAWLEALGDYAFVFHNEDENRTEISLASQRVLEHLGEGEDER